LKIRLIQLGFLRTWALTGLLALTNCWSAAQAHEVHEKMDATQTPASNPCVPVNIRCGRSATPVFGPGGKVWVLWSLDDRLMLSTSEDGGATFPASKAISEKCQPWTTTRKPVPSWP